MEKLKSIAFNAAVVFCLFGPGVFGTYMWLTGDGESWLLIWVGTLIIWIGNLK